jgi:hypothetical protein
MANAMTGQAIGALLQALEKLCDSFQKEAERLAKATSF